MAAFTLTQSEKDPGLFFVVRPDGTQASDINVFLRHLSHLGRSAYTLRSYAQGLAHFFDWLRRTGYQVDEVTPLETTADVYASTDHQALAEALSATKSQFDQEVVQQNQVRRTGRASPHEVRYVFSYDDLTLQELDQAASSRPEHP